MEKEPFSDFETLFIAYKWKPIYGCPGRYILKEKHHYTIKELTHGRTDITILSTNKAPDIVCVVILIDGGIISYKKDDGSFVHTLNNTSGFIRKLEKLEIRQAVYNKGAE